MIKNFVFLFACKDYSSGSIFVSHVIFQIFYPKFIREAAKVFGYSSVLSISLQKRAWRVRIT